MTSDPSPSRRPAAGPPALAMPLDALVPDTTALRAYTGAKQALAREIRFLRSIFQKRQDKDAEQQCQELIVKLAEDGFTLAVLGQFKRGKSSLMNAIIGRAVLPTGVLPLTSAITVLRYGPEERLIVHRDGAIFPEEVPVGRLADYVTEMGNPGNRKGVKTARLELPLGFLRHGLEFVDTPGVGSTIEANTATAYHFLPQCDAAIFVTSVEGPLTRTEMDFLGSILRHVRKVFLVANKTDLLAPNECQEVLAFLSRSVRQVLPDSRIAVYPVSARLGLDARLREDPDAYDRSGLRALEEALASFLAGEKASAFLEAVLDKASRLLAQETEMPPGAADESVAGRVKSRLEALRERIRRGLGEAEPDEPASLPEAPVEAGPTVWSIGQEQERSAEQDMGLPARGCPICGRLEEYAFRFFSNRQYALSADASAQAAFAADLGFCPLHTWQLVAVSSPQGLSIGYPLLLDRVSRRLAESADRPEAPLPSGLPDGRSCRACIALRQAEKEAVSWLARLVGSESGRRAYLGTQGPCLRHLAALLTAVSDAPTRRLLLLHSARRFAEWSEDMQNFALKRDALRRGLLNAAEEDAYLRAIVHLAGTRGLCAPWDLDGEI